MATLTPENSGSVCSFQPFPVCGRGFYPWPVKYVLCLSVAEMGVHFNMQLNFIFILCMPTSPSLIFKAKKKKKGKHYSSKLYMKMSTFINRI